MGRDNQPKERQRRQLERKRNTRPTYDRILIVSEGSKTEPQYFEEIRQAHKLHTANVVVRHSELGTAPNQVVQYAHDLFVEGDPHRRIEPRAFERVFAVFDRDDHDSYFAALDAADAYNGRLKNDMKRLVSFQAIASVPSFELWLLLHYEDIRAPLHRDEVMMRLTERIPWYQKGAKGIYGATKQNLKTAIQHAEQLMDRFTPRDTPEPYTGIVDLVKLMTTLRS